MCQCLNECRRVEVYSEEQWFTLFRLNGKLYCGEAEEHAPSIRCRTPLLITPEMLESAAVCFEQWHGNVRFSMEIQENRKVIKRTLRHADVLMACVRVFSEY